MSNGSERTPERCVHAVDGPDWAGLRELNNATVDYKAIVAEARQIADEEPKGAGTLRALAATVESLLAENLRRHAALHEWESVGAPAWVAAKDAQLAEVWAERDALQARLDAMTVETRRVRYPDKGRLMTTDAPVITEQRLVGPWTVVPEGGE